MKIGIGAKWDPVYDWMIIPTIMLAFRKDEWSNNLGIYLSGFGIGLLFLKLKIEIRFYKSS
jgi:hypothetical protein